MVKIGKYTIEEAVVKYYPIAQRMSKGDQDLQQELMLWVIENLVHRDGEGFNEERIRARMNLQVKAYHLGYLMLSGTGHSIDKGESVGRKDIILVDYDTINEFYGSEIIEPALARMFSGCPNPEELALFKVDYEKFVSSLSVKERKYFEAKAKGMTWEEIDQSRIVDRNSQHRLKVSVIRKFKEYFDM